VFPIAIQVLHANYSKSTKNHSKCLSDAFFTSQVLNLPILSAMSSLFDGVIIERKMPSGKTHDAITILLSFLVSAFAWKISNDLSVVTTIAIGFLFGGLLFGPDLDVASKQYYRWGIFRFLWYPYQVFFKHRSRWSHGLLFGTLFRIVYFAGALTLLSFILAYAIAIYREQDLPHLVEFIKSWSMLIDFIQANFGKNVLSVFFLGTWLGAASHTLTDIAISYVKTGKIKKLL
jgi:uncharacterized metal-binding protein